MSRLVVYDDGSEPWTRLWLQDSCAAVDVVPVDFRAGRRWGSPVAIMAHYLSHNPAERFVKVDNDIALAPGWLDALLTVADAHRYVDLLGFELGMTQVLGRDHPFTFEPSSHIGGIGLMRTRAFENRPLKPLGTHYGFTEWQHTHGEVRRGWITPDLLCPLMDRLPFEPFLSLSARYQRLRWQRPWGTYPVRMGWAWEWMLAKEKGETTCITGS